MKIQFRIILISILLLTHFIGATQLSKTEKKFVKYIDSKNPDAMILLEQVVNINSGSMNFEGVKKVGEVFADQFRSIGMEVTITDGTAYNRAGHLIARTKGGEGRKILLIGHLDTVFEPISPFQKYKRLNDTLASGPGIADMKGGNVIIFQALAALSEQNLLDKMNITVIMTGDEELSGSPIDLARKDLIEAAKWADIALGFENGDGNPATANVSRRSSSGWKLVVKGNAAHSSQVFKDVVGAGAIFEASRIVYQFYDQMAGEEYLTFNPGVFLGGTAVTHEEEMDQGTAFGKSNVVAQDVVVTGDIRCISPEQLSKTQETMRAIVKDNLPKTQSTITFDNGYPPFAPTDGNYELLKLYSKVSRDLGQGEVVAVNPSNAGAADISFTSAYIDMGLDGLGMSGANDHTVNETGNLNALSSQTKRAAILIYRLTR